MLALIAALALQQAAAFPLQRFGVDPSASSIRFLGTSTLHDFEGVAKVLGGEVRVDPARLSATGGGTLWVEAQSLDTDNSSRDEDMRETLAVTQFPRITFELDALEGTLANWTGKLQARGRFTVRGVAAKKTVKLNVTPAANGGFRAKGKVKLSLAEHKIEPPSVLFVTVDDAIEVQFDVVFAPMPSKPVPAKVFALETKGAGANAVPRELWTTEDALVLDLGRDASFVGVRGGEPTSFNAREAKRLSLPQAAEIALQPKNGRTSDILGVGSPVIDRSVSGTVLLKIGDIEWMRVEGLEGEERFCAALLALEGLPRAVRAELADLKGIPERVELRWATKTASGVLDFSVGTAHVGSIPDWMLAPSTWTQGLP